MGSVNNISTLVVENGNTFNNQGRVQNLTWANGNYKNRYLYTEDQTETMQTENSWEFDMTYYM